MRACLRRIVSHPDLSGPALRVYTDFPALEDVTLQYLNFVPPWVVSRGTSVAETAIRNALLAYDEAKADGIDAGHRRYLAAIAESARVLSQLRVSVQNNDNQWLIWNYDEPLLDYMNNYRRSAIQIRERETPIASGPVMIKLLASISPTRELATAEIDMTALFAEGA